MYMGQDENDLSRVLIEGGISGTKVFKFMQIADDENHKLYAKAQDIMMMRDIIGDDKEIVSMAKLFLSNK